MESVGDIVVRSARYVVKAMYSDSVVLEDIDTTMTVEMAKEEYIARFRLETSEERAKHGALYYGIGDAVSLVYKKYEVARSCWDGGTHIGVYFPTKSNKINTAYIYLARVVGSKIVRTPWTPMQEDLCATDYYTVKKPY